MSVLLVQCFVELQATDKDSITLQNRTSAMDSLMNFCGKERSEKESPSKAKFRSSFGT